MAKTLEIWEDRLAAISSYALQSGSWQCKIIMGVIMIVNEHSRQADIFGILSCGRNLACALGIYFSFEDTLIIYFAN